MEEERESSRGDVSTRWVDVGVALLLVAIGAVVVLDSLRIGVSWADDGPKAGYFPFYIGATLAAAGLGIIGQTAYGWRRLSGLVFVSGARLRPVFAMLVPTIAYVVLIAFVGLYVASFVYIAGFMRWQGRYHWLSSIAVGASIPIVVFLLFEVWFLIPLPKGPVERLLGY